MHKSFLDWDTSLKMVIFFLVKTNKSCRNVVFHSVFKESVLKQNLSFHCNACSILQINPNTGLVENITCSQCEPHSEPVRGSVDLEEKNISVQYSM